MSTVLVVSVVIGLWVVVAAVVLAACRAAQRGDQPLAGELCSGEPGAMQPTVDPTTPGTRSPFGGMPGRARVP